MDETGEQEDAESQAEPGGAARRGHHCGADADPDETAAGRPASPASQGSRRLLIMIQSKLGSVPIASRHPLWCSSLPSGCTPTKMAPIITRRRN